jgi:hypothetical protein
LRREFGQKFEATYRKLPAEQECDNMPFDEIATVLGAAQKARRGFPDRRSKRNVKGASFRKDR